MILNDSYSAFVNLQHRNDRLEHMTRELKRVGIEADRQRGMLPSEYAGDLAQVATMQARTPGAIGCHFSQVEVMKKALNQKKHAFIMEDDLIFCDDFDKRINLISEFLGRTEWDVFWLGATFHNPAFWHKKGRSGMEPDCSSQLGRDCEVMEGRFMRTYGAFCTYAYIVNVKSISKIFDLFRDHLHTSIGIDWLFIKLQPQLRTFAFVPGSVKQMDGLSDIGTGKTIFSGFSTLNKKEGNTHEQNLEDSKYWFQERMEDFDYKNYKWI